MVGDIGQMKLTSLYAYWGNWNEARFNELFKQEVERWILKKHSEHIEEGLTDSELLELWEKEKGKKPDTDLIRPRRCDLSNSKKYKSRPAFLYDTGIYRKNKLDKNVIIWKLNQENLHTFLGNE